MILRALVLLRSLNISCKSSKSMPIILRAMRTTLNNESRSSQVLLPNQTIIERFYNATVNIDQYFTVHLEFVMAAQKIIIIVAELFYINYRPNV